MLAQLFTIVVACLTVTVTSHHLSKTWNHHRNFHLLNSGEHCGKVKFHKDTSPRILNGFIAQRGSLPWMALIFIKFDKVTINGSRTATRSCGGSVISKNYILTAAHCMERVDKPNITVVLGVDHYNFVDDPLTETYNVAHYLMHPDYDEISVVNDIALLRLARSISFESPFINSICLPTSNTLAKKSYLGESLTVAGWGEIATGNVSTTLLRAVVPVAKCGSYVTEGANHTSSASQLCAGSGEVRACLGDSGGPLMYKSAGRFVQVGILSFGPRSCSSSPIDEFNYYTRVSSFIDWILDTIEA